MYIESGLLKEPCNGILRPFHGVSKDYSSVLFKYKSWILRLLRLLGFTNTVSLFRKELISLGPIHLFKFIVSTKIFI